MHKKIETCRTPVLSYLTWILLLIGFALPALGATPPVELDATPHDAIVGSKVTISWSAPEAHHRRDWIGLYRVGAKEGWFHPSISWQKTGGAASGTLSFTLPETPGMYEFRFFSKSGYHKIATSERVVVRPESLTECLPPDTTRSKIKHLVVIVQENHSFDSYFGRFCQAPTGSNPECHEGPSCCEGAPLTEPKTGASPVLLNDAQNIAFDPNHTMACQMSEINQGKMDQFILGGPKGCSDPNNFAIADQNLIAPYLEYAKNYALADRYFQPVPGASSSNDMYLARAHFVFRDNEEIPDSVGSHCLTEAKRATHTETTVGDLMSSCQVPWGFFSEGYNLALLNPNPANPVCTGVVYDPSDNPFQYYESTRDNRHHIKDYTDFELALERRTLPAVSFIKGYQINTEHPKAPISLGVQFSSKIIDRILSTEPYKDNTLILLTADESGGYYDHVPPPADSLIDGMPYGARTYLIAIGAFAKKGYVSHVPMEHSSIVRFIEWNFLGGDPGQLGTRDTVVNGLGDLLDPAQTGGVVPVR